MTSFTLLVYNNSTLADVETIAETNYQFFVYKLFFIKFKVAFHAHECERN